MQIFSQNGRDSNGQDAPEMLAGVKKWASERADTNIQDERLDRTLAFADGHRRLAFAQNFMEECRYLKLYVHMYRLVDDSSVFPVPKKAVERNISDWRYSAYDIAEVLRDPLTTEEDMKLLPLERKTMIKQARSLAKLEYKPFLLARILKIEPGHAAAVGDEAEGNEDLQTRLLKIFAKRAPNSNAAAHGVAKLYISEIYIPEHGHQQPDVAKRLEREGQDAQSRTRADSYARPSRIGDWCYSAYDIAEVLRDPRTTEEEMEMLPLERKTMIKEARNIAKMENTPFRLAIDFSIKTGHAAAIGDVAEGNETAQLRLIEMFIKQKPKSNGQAHFMAQFVVHESCGNSA